MSKVNGIRIFASAKKALKDVTGTWLPALALSEFLHHVFRHAVGRINRFLIGIHM